MSDQPTAYERTLTGKHVGRPVDRVEGFAKVTGQARYAAEFTADELLYGVIVSGAKTKGKITKLQTAEALAVPGVVDVLTHENRPDLATWNQRYQDDDAPPGWHFRPLYDATIRYNGQPIALVLAETFESARYAASLVRATYAEEEFETDLHVARADAYAPTRSKSGYEKPKSRGNAERAFRSDDSVHRIEATYDHGMEHHNPMELFATTVVCEPDGAYTIYDKTQGTMNSQAYVCGAFGLAKDKVRVRAPYVGGAFGSGLRPQYQLPLAMMGALKTKRSVRVVMTRQQMFSFGHRPAAIQDVKFSCDASGRLQSITHDCVCETSRFEDYTEIIVNWSGLAYACENVELKHELARIDAYTPLDMRAPGAATGVFALESAMDELAFKAGIDPLEFRLRNYVEKDQVHFGRPFSSKELRACYLEGAERFGWKKRAPEPRSMRDGKKLIGWGMATGIWDATQSKGKAAAAFTKDGKLRITTAVTDIGTGTYTILTQIAAEALGLELDDVRTEIGDTDFPEGPLQGGSWTGATAGTAVFEACRAVGEKLFDFAKKWPDSPFEHVKFDDVSFAERTMFVTDEPARAVALREILARSGEDEVKEEGASAPNRLKQMPFARNTHSAVFIEVRVDEDHGMVEVSRAVAAVAAGRILNPKTARSQVLGGVVWGIGQALHEESVVDHRLGRIMNHSLAEYHLTVNRDVGEIDVIFVDEKDSIASPIGVKGLGEIGIVGTAAAVANAIFHATGRRVRELPITLDKVMGWTSPRA